MSLPDDGGPSEIFEAFLSLSKALHGIYSPIFGLSRLHETFRFISVTRSRTVGRTSWTGDQLVARPLLTALGDCDERFWQGKPKYSEKSCPDTSPTCQTRARTRASAVGSQGLTASAIARPVSILRLYIFCSVFN
jgi:hypothetical protein